MKKNTLFKRVALVLALVLVIALGVGCTPATTPQPTGTNPQPTGTDAPPVSEPDREPGVYFVTVLPSANGTVVADRTEAREGDTITLTVTPDEGYELISLMVNGEESQLTFQMPAEDVSILARFGLPEEKEENKNDGGNVKVYPNGTFFGSAGNYHCSDVLNMKTDKGDNPYLVMDAQKATPLYAYVKGFTGKQFHLEMTVEVTAIRADEGYPKFGLMINDGKEMVKIYLDMATNKVVGGVGAVHQKNGKGDDWAGQSTWTLQKKLDLSAEKVTLGLLRNGSTYYFYVDGVLVATASDLSNLNTAMGIFSFGTSLKVTNYKLVKTGTMYEGLLSKAKADAVVFYGAALTQNYFTKALNGAYLLATDSDAQHLVDDVTSAGKVMRESYYSLKGKLSLSNAENWGQSRILISADPKNEYFIALEKTDGNAYQIFTMSKANEENWENWQLIEPVDRNGNRNSLDFEIVVAGDQLYFLVDDQIYYTSDRVNMTESTVKFTGCNNATTTVEDLALTVYESAAEAKAYAESKANRFGDTFGVSQGNYWTTNGFDLSKDNGSNATVKCTAGAPQYAYLNDVFTDKFVFEASFNVEKVLNNDGYPKFGLLVNGSSEMVKFFMDMTPAMTADKVGVVYQPTGGGDDWGGSVSCDVPGMSFTGSDTVKMKLVRDGRAYYLYVNDELVLHDAEGFKTEKGAVGIFSFNAAMTASKYSYAVDGAADSAIQKAKDDVVAKNKLGLSTNYFTEVEEDKYTLTTNADVGHMVDDVIKDSKTVRTAYYSLKGKLTLSNAGNWGQSRILVSNDAKNEYFIALEKTNSGDYQIFTMSKANQMDWDKWQMIYPGSLNGNRNALDFEIVSDGQNMYFLVDDAVYYVGSHVPLTESTVKFTGCNNATTTVEDLALTVYESAAEAKAYAESKANRFGDTFGVSQGNYWTTNGFDLSKDNGSNATVKCTAGAPQYAYLNDVFTDKFVFEASFNVEKVLNNDGYPKFGLLVNGSSEMVKFFMDMTPAMTADKVGVVYQPTGGGDDWGGSVSCDVPGMSFTGSDTVKMKLVRDGRAYYLYVNDELVLHDAEGFKTEKGAVGIFSFNAVMTASKYSYAVDGAADSAIQKAKEDLDARNRIALTTNHFVDSGNGVFTLNTNSNAENLIDDVTKGGEVVRTAYYSLKGKLTLSNAGNWGQSRILVSNDAKNEYFIALEKTDGNAYQIFTMSKANEENWENWQLIEPVDRNGNRNSLDFEIVVAGDQLYFLVDDQIYYTSDRVNMTESTVKFTGCNNATTTVEDLALTVYESAAEAKAYAESKADRFGDTFGVSQGNYWTTNGFDLSKDNGSNATVKCTAGAPQYAYLNDVFTDKFVFEASFNVEKVLNNDGYPKFGLLVNGSSEMVKFFMDMTPAMTADKVGVVYQPTGGGDDWGGSKSVDVPGMSFTGSDTVKLKLVRDGKAYYFYVNDKLVLYNENGFKSEPGAVGIFSFNTVTTVSGYSVAVDGNANSAIQSAKDTVAAMTKIAMTTNYFTESAGKYSLTTDSNAEHKVDDLTRGGNVLRTAYYSVKGKLTLTNAGDWGQARILISADARNEYFFALEKTNSGKFQFFTMSKANQDDWDVWQEILNQDTNGSRNSLDFEVVVIGKKVYFLVDNAVIYTTERVSMTESTLKFTGYNVGTTTVENLSATVFENQQAAEAYISAK